MPQTIFFSWQADTATLVGRNLIERALERALGRIGADTEVEEPHRGLEIDRDTKGVAGSPPIVDTIFKKIDAATVFLPDLTFVGQRLDGRPTPNPNVLIEYGWALKSLGHGRVVPVMNTAFGEPTAENMPFDMRHLRNPITYHCPRAASEDERRHARDDLSKKLEVAIRAVLADPALRSEQVAPAPPVFVPRAPSGPSSRFRKPGEPLGIVSHYFGDTNTVSLEDHPALWLRVMPEIDPRRIWSIDQLRAAAIQNPLMEPLNRAWSGLGHFRGHDGFGIYPTGADGSTHGTAYLLNTGEIWAIDTYTLPNSEIEGVGIIHFREDDFREALHDYGRVLRRLEIGGRLRWIAGIEGVAGRSIYVPRRDGYMRSGYKGSGSCMLNEIVVEGAFDPDNLDGDTLRPFFERVFEACGVGRPEWLNR